jgi:hypothetical protein
LLKAIALPPSKGPAQYENRTSYAHARQGMETPLPQGMPRLLPAAGSHASQHCPKVQLQAIKA